MHLTLQKDCMISIYGQFFQIWASGLAQIWKLGPGADPTKKVKFQFHSYQNFTDKKTFPKSSHSA